MIRNVSATARRSHLERVELVDLLIEKPSGDRPAHTGQYRDIEELAHTPFKLNPLDDVAGGEVHDLHPAPWIGIPLLQIIVELEPSQEAIARQRQPNDGMSVTEGEAP